MNKLINKKKNNITLKSFVKNLWIGFFSGNPIKIKYNTNTFLTKFKFNLLLNSINLFIILLLSFIIIISYILTYKIDYNNIDVILNSIEIKSLMIYIIPLCLLTSIVIIIIITHILYSMLNVFKDYVRDFNWYLYILLFLLFNIIIIGLVLLGLNFIFIDIKSSIIIYCNFLINNSNILISILPIWLFIQIITSALKFKEYNLITNIININIQILISLLWFYMVFNFIMYSSWINNIMLIVQNIIEPSKICINTYNNLDLFINNLDNIINNICNWVESSVISEKNNNILGIIYIFIIFILKFSVICFQQIWNIIKYIFSDIISPLYFDIINIKLLLNCIYSIFFKFSLYFIQFKDNFYFIISKFWEIFYNIELTSLISVIIMVSILSLYFFRKIVFYFKNIIK